MQFIDSHIHLQDYRTKNAQQIINDLQEHGFAKVVCVSSRPDDWDSVAAIADIASDFIIPAFGLHPWYIKDAPSNWLSVLRSFLLRYPTSWVGECGLDYLKAPSEERQQEVFISQISLAKELKRPLNIHALKAEKYFDILWSQMPSRFMLHSFGGSIEFMNYALNAGAFISLSYSVLKRKNALDIIKNIPLDRLLLESDAPYMSSSYQIPDLVSEISAIKNIKPDNLAAVVYNNFKEFCNV